MCTNLCQFPPSAVFGEKVLFGWRNNLGPPPPPQARPFFKQLNLTL